MTIINYQLTIAIKIGGDRVTSKQLRRLRAIQDLQFTVLELNLFLDTHPENRNALDDYNEAIMELRRLKDEYQKNYGPLIALFPSDYPWQYPKTDWPWQIDY